MFVTRYRAIVRRDFVLEVMGYSLCDYVRFSATSASKLVSNNKYVYVHSVSTTYRGRR